MDERHTLDHLRPGETAAVRELRHGEEMARRLTQLGFVPGTRVTCVARAPWGDPAAYLVRGTVIALRGSDAALVETEPPVPAEGGGGRG